MSTRTGRPKGGVEHYKVGRDGRTLLAMGQDGKEYIVTQERGGQLKDAEARTARRAEALNKRLEEDKKAGLRG